MREFPLRKQKAPFPEPFIISKFWWIQTSASARSFTALRMAEFNLRFRSSDGFSYLWFFLASERIPDFSQVLVNRRNAFSNDSPGRTITPVIYLLSPLLCLDFSVFSGSERYHGKLRYVNKKQGFTMIREIGLISKVLTLDGVKIQKILRIYSVFRAVSLQVCV